MVQGFILALLHNKLLKRLQLMVLMRSTTVRFAMTNGMKKWKWLMNLRLSLTLPGKQAIDMGSDTMN
jgi:hypothetical protein